jgi:hypothetical protein
MKISNLFLTISFLLFQGILFAQVSGTISGKVTDINGQPLAGASVIVKGTIIGAQADFDGFYTLSNVPQNSILVFSYIGYMEQEFSLENSGRINVVLQADTEALDEVVLVG